MKIGHVWTLTNKHTHTEITRHTIALAHTLAPLTVQLGLDRHKMSRLEHWANGNESILFETQIHTHTNWGIGKESEREGESKRDLCVHTCGIKFAFADRFMRFYVHICLSRLLWYFDDMALSRYLFEMTTFLLLLMCPVANVAHLQTYTDTV